MSAWEEELGEDFDREFILQGIQHGFDLIDMDIDKSCINKCEVDNYSSATDSGIIDKVEEQILHEVSEGNYVICKDKPTIVSAIGTVPKPNSNDIRLIHDCSKPMGGSLNHFATIEKTKYQSIDDAVKLSSHKCFYAKIDLKSAYRSVRINPNNYAFTGLKWKFKGEDKFSYMFDSKLPFGARKSPFIFHRLTQSVRRMMAKKGFECIIVYLDDFLIIGDNFEECKIAYNVLLKLLRKLGFYINWKKVVDPSQHITFLGIDLNSIDMCLELSKEKCNALKIELNSFLDKKRASKKQMQSLAGKLNWACQAIHGGRTFLRRILDTQNKSNRPSHKTLLDINFKADILWWIHFMDSFNGKAMFIKFETKHEIVTDACNQGGGVVFGGDWEYVNWELDWPLVKDLHINHKETLAFIIAAKRWAPFLEKLTSFILYR